MIGLIITLLGPSLKPTGALATLCDGRPTGWIEAVHRGEEKQRKRRRDADDDHDVLMERSRAIADLVDPTPSAWPNACSDRQPAGGQWSERIASMIRSVGEKRACEATEGHFCSAPGRDAEARRAKQARFFTTTARGS